MLPVLKNLFNEKTANQIMKITGYRIRTSPMTAGRALYDTNSLSGNGATRPGSPLYTDSSENVSRIGAGETPTLGNYFRRSKAKTREL